MSGIRLVDQPRVHRQVGERQPAAGDPRGQPDGVGLAEPDRLGQRAQVRAVLDGRPPPASVAPSASTTTSSTPAPHSWRSVPAGSRPVRTRVCAAPTLGCPAKGSSADGVKIRTR